MADAPQGLRARDAQQGEPRWGLRAKAAGDAGGGGGSEEELREGGGRRSSDVRDGDERDNEHAVGRDCGRGGREEHGGEGVQGGGGGDHGAFRATKFV